MGHNNQSNFIGDAIVGRVNNVVKPLVDGAGGNGTNNILPDKPEGPSYRPRGPTKGVVKGDNKASGGGNVKAPPKKN